ncbi:SMI1/KNR4 family protein [Exiguobacterium sp. s192]|uniref:SMI1/KNR4 family protein n=1 Tax=Exiguobacterium sp. s192 TaxID=2751206 RepID=UPI001BEA1AFF|nr:SMI1/KNR4 family protein [Exiguobacterium sp. s192]
MVNINAKFNRCLKLIEKYPQAFIVGKGSTENEILEIENRLRITLPTMYKEFLRKFSYLATHDEEIWGINPSNNQLDIVFRNKKYNEELRSSSQSEIPSHLIGIQVEDFNSSLVCLDLHAMTYNDQDAKVCFYPSDEPYYADSFTQVLFEVCDSAVSSYLDDKENVPSPSIEKVSEIKTERKDVYSEAKALIHAHPELSEFGEGISDAEVEVIEKELKVTLPKSYVTFLKEFGGGIFGDNQFFTMFNDELVKTNLELYHPTEYEHALSKHLVAFYFDDLEEFYACLDFKNVRNGEPKVVYREVNVPEEDYDDQDAFKSFSDFLYYIVQDTIDVNG